MMASIACLGWGSLVWNPGDLPIRRPWITKGPQVCVEFLRQSHNGRLTLVLDQSAAPVQSQWTMMASDDIPEAVSGLRLREGILPRNEARGIGVWRRGGPSIPTIPDLAEWAAGQNLDAVIWTNLGPKFNGEPRAPTVEEAVSYLTTLTGQIRQDAEEYIRKAPVDTVYRGRILLALA